MNTLSIVAAFGALVWIFQDGNLSALLGFQPLGYVETTQPVILFCILFGLSMDYEVFLLSRMKEVWDRTGDNTRGRRPRPRTERPDRHLGRAHRRRRRRVVRLRRHRPDQGDRARRRDLGGARRDGRPGAARSGDDAPARRPELVDAGPARALAQRPAADRGRPRGRAAMTRRRLTRDRSAALAILAVAATILGACSGPVLANPAAGRGPVPPRRDPAPGAERSAADRAPGRRCAARPADRVVVLHRPPARRGGRALRLRVRRLPRRAGRLPGDLGVAPGDHRRDRPGVPLRPAQRDRRPGRHSPDVVERPDAFALAISGVEPGLPRDGRPPWVMRGSDGRDRLAAQLSPEEARAAAAPGGLGLDLQLTATTAAGPPRRRRLGRLRAGRRVVLLLAHARWMPPARSCWTAATLDVTGTAWFDHQWGDFISVGGGGWDWFAVNLDDGTDLTLSLVRTPMELSTRVRDPGRRPDGRRDTSTGRRSGSTPPAPGDRPDRGDLSGGLDDRDPRRGLRIGLQPTVPDQELDTRATTGVVYWEGSQVVDATRDGSPSAVRPTSS